ncbi:SUKH-4 family immunity protein [Streptomyces cavernicola]|uniref:SUKH-4 immunity protein of toxin-antitoxin system n=1 Tax=Streptomyces cavernicola TaxID=3043613 RepID=A0ABT6SA52_9ACTN|nr:SUKH-4 family immunity protein [Streptomyces sp. B-S-A6]MDI3405062.1 hypothetical protein [Streptomyces sp. B-S-A6]
METDNGGTTVPETPDAAWLEERFGEGSLWRPQEADLPAELTDRKSREFLLTVGFPAVRLDVVGIDTTSLRDEGALEPFDADELYGNRRPDDDTPPENFSFFLAARSDQHLMLDDHGGITHYDPNGWDHARGWKGPAAASLPSLAALLGLIAESADSLDRSTEEGRRSAAIADLQERMIAHDVDVDSDFWNEVFEHLE